MYRLLQGNRLRTYQQCSFRLISQAEASVYVHVEAQLTRILPFILSTVQHEAFFPDSIASTLSIPQVLPDLGLYVQGQTVDDDGG
jgi:hypothetical protein